jgi:type III secretion protein S
MDNETIVRLASEGLLMCLLVSLPAVAASAIIGLLIAFVQAITLVQDSSISQSVKLILIGLVVLVAAPWGAAAVLRFGRTALQAVYLAAG